jgi:hypothetical protein
MRVDMAVARFSRLSRICLFGSILPDFHETHFQVASHKFLATPAHWDTQHIKKGLMRFFLW